MPWNGAAAVDAITPLRDRAISGTKQPSSAWNLRNRNQRPRPPNVLCEFDDCISSAESLSDAFVVLGAPAVSVANLISDDAHSAEQFRFLEMEERADPWSLQRHKRESSRREDRFHSPDPSEAEWAFGVVENPTAKASGPLFSYFCRD